MNPGNTNIYYRQKPNIKNSLNIFEVVLYSAGDYSRVIVKSQARNNYISVEDVLLLENCRPAFVAGAVCPVHSVHCTEINWGLFSTLIPRYWSRIPKMSWIVKHQMKLFGMPVTPYLFYNIGGTCFLLFAISDSIKQIKVLLVLVGATHFSLAISVVSDMLAIWLKMK